MRNIFLFFLLLTSLPSFAQNVGPIKPRCSSENYYSGPSSNAPSSQFENWMTTKKIQQQKRLRSTAVQEDETRYRVPVVFHIIHRPGEQIGEGSNISTAQILSQLDVINEDYQRTNADANLTRPEFQDVASSLNIEFVLAKQDPFGNPTTGITRVNGLRNNWGDPSGNSSLDAELKSYSYWPSEDYLNIWVAPLRDGILGYASWPETDIGGVGAPSAPLQDGVVINFIACGSIAKGNFPDIDPDYDLGRTLTHEIGHFFGLLHVSGAGGCNSDDFCTDTPPQARQTQGDCANFGANPPFSCGTEDMYENYMDYTFDACMNAFTHDQATRAHIVLENSPRRASLLDSHGLVDPDFEENAISLGAILSPEVIANSDRTSLKVVLRNFGENQVTSVNIHLDFGSFKADLATEVNIASKSADTLAFKLTELPEQSELFTVTVDSVNHQPNTALILAEKKQQLTANSATASLPYLHAFDNPFINSDGWQVPNFEGAQWVSKKQEDEPFVAALEEQSVSPQYLISPLLPLDGAPSDSLTLTFQTAVTPENSSFMPQFSVLISEPENENLLRLKTLTDNDFENTAGKSYKKHYIDLTPFRNQAIRLVLDGQNNSSSSLLMKNLRIQPVGINRLLQLNESQFTISPSGGDEPMFRLTTKGSHPAVYDLVYELPQTANVALRIVSIDGRQVFSKILEGVLHGSCPLPTQGYASGIYLLQINSPQHHEVKRFFIP